MSIIAVPVHQLPPLSLYIHIPWCVKKCPYCDFNSHVADGNSSNIPEAEYVQQLKQDLLQDSHWKQGRKLSSIFFGGGTPSLFSPRAIGNILDFAEKTLGFSDDIEITMEANPGTFEQEKFLGYYQAGINRLSIGIQSFDSEHLKKLGRIHNSDEAIRAISIAQQAGFDNINLDLMHGLPQQTIEQAVSDLRTAIRLNPQHISWYQLTIEPNTEFYRQPPPLPVDDVLADIQQHGSYLLTENGFEQYEISAFSQTGRQSKHNLNYWQFGDYIGIGAGAHGKLTDISTEAHHQIIRRQKTRYPAHYLSSPTFKEHIVDTDELPLEFMMNVLRLTHGVPMDYFEQRTGLALQQIEKSIHTLTNQGLLEKDTSYLKTSALGQRFLNTVLQSFHQ